MKKSLTALLVSVLLAVLCAFAAAEETGTPELMDLWDYGGESMTWITTVIPVVEGMAVASPAALPDDTEHLAVFDGKTFWEVRAVLPDDYGLLTAIYYDPAGKPSRCTPWPLMNLGMSVAAEDCIVRTGDSMGSRINRSVLYAQELTRGYRCEVLSLTGPAAPGSPVITPDGQLAGIVAAEWSEGTNRVLAVAPDEIAFFALESSMRLKNLPGWQETPTGMDVTVERNGVTVEWTEEALPARAEGENLYLIVSDTGNDYWQYWQLEDDARSFFTRLPPGRFYMAGFVAAADGPKDVPGTYATFGIPAAKPLTEYDFQPLLTTLAEAPEGGNGEEAPVPVTEITRELLNSGRAYFYASASYELTEDILNLPLMITLTAPDGNCYCHNSGWSYLKECMTEDIWYLSLKEMGLTEGPEQQGYPAGVYRMAYYVNGYLADTFEFEIK